MAFNTATLLYAAAACAVVAVLPWVHGLQSSWGYRGFKVHCEKGIRLGSGDTAFGVSRKTSSKAKCLQSCFARPECESISYSPETGQCYLGDSTKDVSGASQDERYVYCSPEEDQVWERAAITVELPTTTLRPTTMEPNECDSDPCQNRAVCNDGLGMFTCDCTPGYEGTTCNTNINECSSNPCQNGGTCADGISEFTCSCVMGYGGVLCDGDTNECASNPCQNGVCNDGVNSYTCDCSSGYEGTLCDTNINECNSNPCQNGGTCADGISEFTCSCVMGYGGVLCDGDTNECASSPCQNGVCNDGVDSYTCTCSVGYEGTLCDTNTNECASSPCQNGVCNDGVDSYTCTCSVGYEGTLCDTNTNECSSSPCMYDGTCTDQINSFTCSCVTGTRGELCNIGEPIRLVNGQAPNEGRVELLYNDVWGTVCNDEWDINDANVACRQLGFPGATDANTSPTHGPGSGSIHLDNTNCAGTEVSLGSCPHGGWGVHNCNHNEDVSLKCRDIRLASGPLSSEGRVELYYNGAWGTVCDDYWDINDGHVACRQLGYPSAAQVWSGAYYGVGTGAILLDDMMCSGSEARLGDCSHNGWGVENCGHGEDASVKCNTT